jgi:hypothetical protein
MTGVNLDVTEQRRAEESKGMAGCGPSGQTSHAGHG